MRPFACPLFVLSGALSFSPLAFASASQPGLLAAPPAPTQATAPATQPAAAQPSASAQTDGSTQVAPQTSAPATEIWQVALTRYELGEADVAAELLRNEIVACTVEQTKVCAATYVGTLYACLGIVLSGGKADHNAGVQAFRKALSLSPEIVIYPTYQTAPVLAAFNEAKTGQVQPAASGPAPGYAPATYAQGESQQALAADDDAADEEAMELEKKHWIMLISAGAQVGPSSLWFRNSGYYDSNITRTAVDLTGRFTIGGMPGRTSGFTVGARMTGGALIHNEAYGHLGASGVLGSTIGKRKEGNCFYFFGSGGFFYLPSFEQVAPTVGFEGGAMLHGFNVGLIADFTASNRFSSILLGIEVGWGHLM